MRLKQLLRLTLLATAFPPLSLCYIWFYRLSARLAARRLARVSGVIAVYVKPGVAIGDILPGISDVDLVLIGEPNAAENIRTALLQCQRYLPLLDTASMFFVPSLLQRIHRECVSNLITQESQWGWQLLEGVEVTKALPPLSQAALRRAYYQGAQQWWTVLSIYLLPEPRNRWERAWAHSCAYKIVAEWARTLYALETGHYLPLRREALTHARPYLDPTTAALVERVETLYRRRFLPADPDLRSDVYRGMVSAWEEFHAEGRHCPPLCESWELEIDAPLEETQLCKETMVAIYGLVQTAKTAWGAAFRGAALVPSATLPLESRALLLFSDTPPDLKALQTVCKAAELAQASLSCGLYVFLQMHRTAFRIYCPAMHQRHRQSLLTPELNPDIYHLVQELTYLIEGVMPALAITPNWEEWSRQYVGGVWENVIARECLEINPESLAPSELKTAWCKALQIALLERQNSRHKRIVPLTKQALKRAIEREGLHFPIALNCVLEQGEGGGETLRTYYQDAMALLREVEVKSPSC